MPPHGLARPSRKAFQLLASLFLLKRNSLTGAGGVLCALTPANGSWQPFSYPVLPRDHEFLKSVLSGFPTAVCWSGVPSTPETPWGTRNPQLSSHVPSCHPIALVHCDLLQTRPNQAPCLAEDSRGLLGHSVSPSCLHDLLRSPSHAGLSMASCCPTLYSPWVLPRVDFMAASVCGAVSLPWTGSRAGSRRTAAHQQISSHNP